MYTLLAENKRNSTKNGNDPVTIPGDEEGTIGLERSVFHTYLLSVNFCIPLSGGGWGEGLSIKPLCQPGKEARTVRQNAAV